MSEIAHHIEQINRTLSPGVRLVAVSKFHPVEALIEAYEAGQRIFGESRVQELVAKQEHLPRDVEWHFIGHLQTNKVKYIAPFISLIHSIDSEKLLSVVETEATKCGRVIDCLLEVHVAQEDSKYGFTPEACWEWLNTHPLIRYPHVRVRGLMGMATQSDDLQLVEREFEQLKRLFDQLKASGCVDADAFDQLSMGMSHDYHLAMRQGSTLVRIGSSIFGERTY